MINQRKRQEQSEHMTSRKMIYHFIVRPKTSAFGIRILEYIFPLKMTVGLFAHTVARDIGSAVQYHLTVTINLATNLTSLASPPRK